MSATWTYSIGDGGHIKVGRCSGPNGLDPVIRRMKALQTGNPRPLFLLGVFGHDIEREAHLALKQAGVVRAAGEWFPDTELTRSTLRALRLMDWG